MDLFLKKLLILFQIHINLFYTAKLVINSLFYIGLINIIEEFSQDFNRK